MSYITVIKGDLLKSSEQYIAHQCNCVTRNGGSGLARAIFDTFPYADVYKNREEGTDKPGDIVIRGNGEEQRYVIAMMSQVYPGGPNLYDIDSYANRKKYFQECLTKIAAISDIKSVAFPYNIGCGLANGKWEDYYDMLNIFFEEANKKSHLDVIIYNNG